MGSTNVDLQMSGTLDFGEQLFTHFDVAFNAAPQQYTRIIGTEGVLSFEKSFNPGNEASEAYLLKGSDTKRIKFKREDAYQKKVEHFYNVVVSKERHASLSLTPSKTWWSWLRSYNPSQWWQYRKMDRNGLVLTEACVTEQTNQTKTQSR
jgi:hypothetical protein